MDFDKGNIVSTMSLVRMSAKPRFDESLKRLVDWDLWLSLLPRKGIHCGHPKLFETETIPSGISGKGSGCSYKDAVSILRKKYGRCQ